MRTIALINQKGGVGKTTTAVNLAAALAEAGRRVVVMDLDPQANLTLHLGFPLDEAAGTTYDVLLGNCPVAQALRSTPVPGLRAIPTDIHLSGAELELANAIGRETILRDAVESWRQESRKETGEEPADYLLFDCPPSLGLLSINALAAAEEVFIAVQTEFFALQGMSKLVEVVGLVRRRMHPPLRITGIIPCLYDSRLRLAREVLAELRRYFPGQVFRQTIGLNVKLAEAPSFGKTILEYAPDSNGARDYRGLAREVIEQERGSTEAPPPGEEPVSAIARPEAPDEGRIITRATRQEADNAPPENTSPPSSPRSAVESPDCEASPEDAVP